MNSADYHGSRRLPLQATDATPGSEEKIRVLEDRAEKGFNLWHPLDFGSQFPSEAVDRYLKAHGSN